MKDQSRVTARSDGARAMLLGVGVAVVLVGAFLGLVGAGSDRAEVTTAAGRDHLNFGSAFGTPCPDARELTSIPAVMDGHPVWQSTLRQYDRAWVCGDSPTLLYGPIEVSFEGGWRDVDVPDKWQALIRDHGGYTTAVRGREAVVQPSTGGEVLHEVMIVKGDVLIRLLAERDTLIDELVELAKTLSY